ncbi:hypothetical protein FRC12_023729 [Ceratobasidium sp. 428]|nr:hypothetical protein FRC12_023729 [Ceratobasidium sp. 428]
MKDEIGSRESDPLIQAAQSYSQYWSSSHVRGLLNKCCCPSILVATAGPWMTILGAVFLDRPVVQPLTDLLWIGHDPARPSELAYITWVFHCASLALQSLAEFYCDVPIPHDNLSRFFPYVTHYTDAGGRLVEFSYLKSLSETYPADGTSIFLAETQNLDPPKQIVVKFVQTYNAKAHELLAKHGLAPALLYDGNAHPQDQPGPNHTMVVMEFLHGTDLSKFKDPLPSRIVTDIQKALEHLHEYDFVFRDLRSPNVIIMKDSHGAVTGAQLIDFDWCGQHQVGRYLLSMNPDVDWAEGVGPGTLMYKSHDIDMLEKLKFSVVVL